MARSVAVALKGLWTRGETWRPAPLQLYAPKSVNTVISEVVIENLVRDQMFVTAIIPADDAQKGGYKPSVAYDPSGQALDAAATNDPELFVLPMPGRAMPGDQFRVTITTFEPLAFEEGSYLLRLPCELPPSVVPQGYTHTQLLDVMITINTGSPMPVKYDIKSGHPLTPGVQAQGTATLSLSNAPQSPNCDLEVGYRVWGNDMFLALSITPPRAAHPSPADPDPRGSFVLTVAPPAPEYTQPFPRSLIFILDRSGSMSGEPMEFAKAALIFGLRSLTPMDSFTVVAFDHEQLWFTPGGELLPATAENLGACEAWVRGSIAARGLTDIMGPLNTAMTVLAARPPQQPPSLPFIFLVTDGCVQDEKDICRYVEGQVRALQAAGDGGPEAGGRPPPGIPRICTFGIGAYCNHYFLKQLATYGRGACDAAFRPHAIQAQMQHMLTAAQRPVLSDLTLTLPGVADCELYPFPLPDLFCGMPLVVSGKYSGDWPAHGISLNGTVPSGAGWSSNPVMPGKDTSLPLDKVFIKSRLDMLTAQDKYFAIIFLIIKNLRLAGVVPARPDLLLPSPRGHWQAWLAGNPPQMVNRIVDLSIATGVPCAHTRTVGFETTHSNYQAMQDTANSQGKRKVNYAKYAIGGAAGLVVLAGLGIGAAFAFGDLGATASNTGEYGCTNVRKYGTERSQRKGGVVVGAEC
ncbi:Inter-alpha-trypsin inhibitor heavy chain H4 [Tetrabaena socialis]|uniref:Inter-alpha-trypsin inhibitor heavy chain H4 n=1 Tax=Tetrabaena socialis TaxID=47790 RepID=A0A2J7ZPC7_9CHLO|nr:Inter-alpha-trypsin inhibitor heavy chain H4 [Tetrabaena socialis]|eukprot:PNH02127.1 Inter-alpha-trypsin inhibitor heavy chain H4 [Tetrabaena socialis]